MTLSRLGLLGVLWSLAGCPAGDDANDYPTAPGGGTPAEGGGGDTSDDTVPIDDAGGDGAETITGRVCVRSPIRTVFRGTCADADVAATVEIDGRTTTTAANGAFAIALDSPIAADAVFRVTGTDLVPTVMPQTAASRLFATSLPLYLETLNQAGAVEPQPGQGIIVVQILDGLTPVEGALVRSDLQSDLGTLYDIQVDPSWEASGLTGAEGLAWIAQTGVGDNIVTVLPPNGADPVDVVLPVEDGAITFHQIELP